jgi:predicted ABC-type transport system involved in lysophospholipase L1 biosynthesis ATPase subunit
VVEPGSYNRLLLATETDLALFLRLLVGTAHPTAGTVLLFGHELPMRPETAALALFARLALVWPSGGFVSNLKTWENILLPLWYHGDAGAEHREGEVIDLLGRIGMEPARIPDFLSALPGILPAREQRILGVVRAMMQEADVMIYAGLFEDLDGPTRARLLEETARHHARRPGRASLFVAASPQGLPDPFVGRSLRQDESGAIASWP